MKLQAGPRRVIVKYVEPKSTTESGLVIPGEAQDKEILESEIVAEADFATEKDARLKPGWKLLFMRDGTAEIRIRGEKYLLVHRDNIIAVIDDTEPVEKQLPPYPAPR